MNKRLYLGSGMAVRRCVSESTETTAKAIMVLADNQDEATGKVMRLLKAALPADDGWREHESSCAEIGAATVAVWAAAYGYVKG
jgi:hypothetical protein